MTFTQFSTASISVYTLVLMSLDRYLAIVHAISSKNIRTQRNAFISIAVTWLAGLTVNIPICLISNVYEFQLLNHHKARCSITINWAKIVFANFFVFGYLIPLSIIVILYGLTVKHLLYNVSACVSQSEESMRCRRRASKMVAVIVIVFALSWLPLQINFLYTSFKPKPSTKDSVIFLLVSQILCYSNSCMNPILYSFLSENFRREFHQVLCWRNKGRTASVA
ncbi:allatostatin-A receptor-like [Lineus longissimus]|uniref:allatostatin-A receptor-like n=1 Tax=Lineus longissimus TaxID=88925 RepID=UPI00315C5754